MNKDEYVTSSRFDKPEAGLEHLTTAHIKIAADSDTLKRSLTTAHLKPAPSADSVQSASTPAPKADPKK